jgi:hypothetical protein
VSETLSRRLRLFSRASPVLVTMTMVLISAGPATASTLQWSVPPTLMAGQLWMIKSNDLASIGGVGSYEWIGCGLTTAPLTPNNYTPCQPGQVPIYTDYSKFQKDVSSGLLSQGTTVIFDNEVWKYTPAWEQAHQIHYEQLAAQLAAENGITFINAPYGESTKTTIAEDVGAAKYASVVEIQAQTLDRNPKNYAAFVKKDVAAIRAATPDVTILAGLATDAGGIPTSANAMYQEYKSVKNIVQGFWLNADTWGPPHARGCASQGCPATARSFLKMIGVSG